MLAAAFALSAMASLARDAGAYCRTTTIPLEASTDDPSQSGLCWHGTPLAWPAGRVAYGVSMAGSKYVSPSDATRIADLAFSVWNSAPCGSGNPAVQAYDVGLLSFVPDGSSCDPSTVCQPMTNDVIYFRDETWPYNDVNNTLALTTVSYGVDDGKIFQAYTEVNTARGDISAEEPAPSGMYDLQAILTHEAGHFLGLAHSTNPSAVMWRLDHSGLITLTQDDIDGICAVYPASPASPASCSCQAAPAGSSVLGLLSVLGVVCLATMRRTPSRRGRGVRLRVLSRSERQQPTKADGAEPKEAQRSRSVGAAGFEPTTP